MKKGGINVPICARYLNKKRSLIGSHFLNIYSELFQVVAWLQACHFLFGKAGS
ncbi:hypothetical protein ABIB50_005133, partial [Mucilaginibacter sp. UYCu711]